MRIAALLGLISGLLLTTGMTTADRHGISYVDDDGLCGHKKPCYTTIQAAINVGSEDDTILVYPGTYDPRQEVTPPCWGGHYYAEAIVVWKEGLTIRAVDPDPANTIIESDFPGWMDGWRLQILTGGTYGEPPDCGPSSISGGYAASGSAAPSAIIIVKDGVTVEGFTIRSTYIGDPGQTDYVNAAGVMIGGLSAGDTVVDGVDGTTIRNNVISGWSAVYNWKSSNTLLEGNTLTNIETTTAPIGSTVAVYGGYNQGNCSRSATGMRLVDNEITQVDDTNAVFFGGDCNGPIDNSDLYIDGNTIVSPYSYGIELRGSGGSNKVMTCNNVVSAALCPYGVCVSDDSTFDGPYGLDTDGDGTPDCEEELVCANATADVPEKGLGTNRWIWDGNAWITDSPSGTDAPGAFTIWQTKGCGCFQILDWLATNHPGEYGKKEGYYKHGCPASVIEAFIELSSTPTE